MNKFVLRFSGSATEYAGVFGPDELPDNHNYIKILDGTRPVTARMFMSNAQYTELPANFKACAIDQTDGLCSIQLTTNSLDIAAPEDGFAERTIQTSYCFMLVSAQVVSSGVDTDIREIRLASVQQLWNKATIFCAYNTRSTYSEYPEDATDLAALTTRQVILDAVIAQISSTLRYGATIAPTLPNKAYTASGFSAQKFMPPVNFVCQYEGADKAIRRLIDPCGYNFIFNPWKSSLGAVAAGDFSVVNITGVDDLLDDVEALLAAGRYNGSAIDSVDETWGNWSTPGTVRFIYQKSTPATVETSSNAIIGYSDSTNSGGKSWVTLPVYANEYTTGSCLTWWKGQTLEAIAGRTGIKPRIWQLVGAYTVVPGKAFRSVTIDYSKNGVFTNIIQHGYVEPEGKREYGISINPEDFNIVSASGVVLDRRADGTIDMIGGGGGDTDPNVYYKVHAEYTAGTSNNPADVDYCNSAGTTTGSTGSETIVTLPFGTVIATTNVIVKGETPTKLTSDVQWDTPYLKKRFRYQFQKFATAEGAWTTFATATTYP